METTNVNSQEIKSVTYDEVTQQLYVRFTNGDYYVYYDVLSVDYVGLLSTEDHNQFVKSRLTNKYESRKLN